MYKVEFVKWTDNRGIVVVHRLAGGHADQGDAFLRADAAMPRARAEFGAQAFRIVAEDEPIIDLPMPAYRFINSKQFAGPRSVQ